jgi:hypothetical protein
MYASHVKLNHHPMVRQHKFKKGRGTPVKSKTEVYYRKAHKGSGSRRS